MHIDVNNKMATKNMYEYRNVEMKYTTINNCMIFFINSIVHMKIPISTILK